MSRSTGVAPPPPDAPRLTGMQRRERRHTSCPLPDDPHADYVRLVNAAIEGPDTFELKRERVDEYGWRHFGDLYADHEAVLGPGLQTPRVALQQPV